MGDCMQGRRPQLRQSMAGKVLRGLVINDLSLPAWCHLPTWANWFRKTCKGSLWSVQPRRPCFARSERWGKTREATALTSSSVAPEHCYRGAIRTTLDCRIPPAGAFRIGFPIPRNLSKMSKRPSSFFLFRNPLPPSPPLACSPRPPPPPPLPISERKLTCCRNTPA